VQIRDNDKNDQVLSFVNHELSFILLTFPYSQRRALVLDMPQRCGGGSRKYAAVEWFSLVCASASSSLHCSDIAGSV